MLEKLLIKNFQKHKKLLVEFDPQVTTIVGKTDCGKSSIIRALRFVCLNKLGGKPDEYIHWDAQVCKVLLKVSGRNVKRTKGRVKGENVYHLDNSPFKFDSVKRIGVPDEIQSVLKLDANNFQRQLDSVFWLADGNSQLARNLNQIVNLEVMDRVLSNGNRKLKELKSRVQLTHERIKESAGLKKSLEWVLNADELLTRAETLEKELGQKRDRIAYTGRLLQTGANARRTVVRVSHAMLGGKKAVSAGEQYRRCASRVKNLQELMNEVTRLHRLVHTEIPDIQPLQILRTKSDHLAESRRNLEQLIQEAKEKEKELWQIQDELKSASSKLAKMKLICPTCGQTIKS